MHALTLSSSLALALWALTTNARKTASPPKIDEPPPFYDWEHRTICKQDLLNPRRQSLEEPLNFEVIVVGYAWDETNALQPDHKWNWNSTANANRKIQDHLNYSGMIVSDGKNDHYNNENYKFQSGKPDDRGYTQFTVEFIIGQKYNPIAEALNMALGIEGCECDDNTYEDCECDDDNPYTSIVCLDQETSLPESEGGPRPHYPSHEEMRYVQAEDEMLLQRQRFQQLHDDRRKATDGELAKSDDFVQEHAGKAPKKTLEMEESDRRIQAMAHGPPQRVSGSFTA